MTHNNDDIMYAETIDTIYPDVTIMPYNVLCSAIGLALLHLRIKYDAQIEERLITMVNEFNHRNEVAHIDTRIDLEVE